MSKLKVVSWTSTSINRSDETNTGRPLQFSFRKAALSFPAMSGVSHSPSVWKKSPLRRSVVEGCMRRSRMARHMPSGSFAICHLVTRPAPLRIEIVAPDSWLTEFASARGSSLEYKNTEWTCRASELELHETFCRSPTTRAKACAEHMSLYFSVDLFSGKIGRASCRERV